MNKMTCQPTSTNSITNSAWCLPTWKSVGGFSKYRVCKHGTVQNCKTQRVLNGTIDKDGYKRFFLRTGDGKPRLMSGHRLVTLAFLSNPNNKEQVDHLDRNKTNNCVYNLRWTTHSENQINKGLCKRKFKGDGFRHIQTVKINGCEYFRLQIMRNSKYILVKNYRTDKYTLEQVVKIRNDFYKIHDIEVDDE
jgi:hypothetical protein